MPFLGMTVGEMAAVTLGTVARLIEVLAKLSLVCVGQILKLFLGGNARRIKAIVLLLQ